MDIADLARWTPIRFDLSGPAPTVDWADLSTERFVEPFSTRPSPAGPPARTPSRSSGPDSMRSSPSITNRHLTRRA